MEFRTSAVENLVRGTGGPAQLYTARNLPIFQNRMFQSSQEARGCVRGDVNLIMDQDTGLIFNHTFQPELMTYDVNYQNEQAVSAVFREHLNDICAIMGRHFRSNSLIEVGCGKGHFLEQMQSRGFRITGLDPSYEGSNPSIMREYFAPGVGLRADGIILRHVLEHIQDPVGFLSRIRDTNGGSGKVYIEVPCFDWICEHRAWFDIFYEHVNYFRLSDFYRMFEVISEAGHVFNGQYLYVIADLASIRAPRRSACDDFRFPDDFLATVANHARRLMSGNVMPSAVWGGASKGVIFTRFMEQAGAAVDMVVDANPAKHGKFLPGTGLQVRSPAEAMEMLPDGANIIVMNGNYFGEIKCATRDRFNYFTVDNDCV